MSKKHKKAILLRPSTSGETILLPQTKTVAVVNLLMMTGDELKCLTRQCFPENKGRILPVRLSRYSSFLGVSNGSVLFVEVAEKDPDKLPAEVFAIQTLSGVTAEVLISKKDTNGYILGRVIGHVSNPTTSVVLNRYSSLEEARVKCAKK